MNSELDILIAELRNVCDKAHPGPWTAAGNLPFNVDLQKPRPSLSKHDDKRPTYWHCDDAIFVLRSRTLVPALLDALELARAQRNELIYDYANEIDYYGTAKTQAAISDPKVANADAQLAAALRGEATRAGRRK